MKPLSIRRAARLIVLDSLGRVLLFRHRGLGGGEFWAPPGGGVEPGESFEAAAAREAAEELAVTNVQLQAAWEGVAEFQHVDGPVRQHERFFVVTAGFGSRGDAGEVHEHEGILEQRWWSAEEIEASAERIFPEGLPVQMRTIRR